MSMSVDGLISGMDTTNLINQLIAAESGQQNQLKLRLKTSELAASAYRTVNTTFAAVRAAADTVLKAETWTATKATSSASSVAVSSGGSALTGALTFTVDALAANHGVVNENAAWTDTSSAYGAASIEVFDKAGVSKGVVTIGGSGTLADAAAALNAADLGVSASVVRIRGGATPEYALQVTSKTSGADSEFTLTGAGTFGVTTQGADARLTIGTGPAAYQVWSNTNTFDGVLPGATLTVSKQEAAPVTVTVADDPDSTAAKVQALVDAVNSAITNVKTYTNNSKGSTAALKGDYAVTQLSGQLLDAVSFAVGADGSPAKVGFELSKDGKVTFDKATFVAALKADPELAQRMVGGTAAGPGGDGVTGTSDDVAATGIAGRLQQVAQLASNSTTGSLVKLAEGQDSLAEDIQDRIEAWDLRLAKRKESLVRQFTAMETALSSLKNQSTWLAGQINGLPKWE